VVNDERFDEAVAGGADGGERFGNACGDADYIGNGFEAFQLKRYNLKVYVETMIRAIFKKDLAK
jgi:hypothetical protein